jgi:hypothetical protein
MGRIRHSAGSGDLPGRYRPAIDAGISDATREFMISVAF